MLSCEYNWFLDKPLLNWKYLSVSLKFTAKIFSPYMNKDCTCRSIAALKIYFLELIHLVPLTQLSVRQWMYCCACIFCSLSVLFCNTNLKHAEIFLLMLNYCSGDYGGDCHSLSSGKITQLIRNPSDMKLFSQCL